MKITICGIIILLIGLLGAISCSRLGSRPDEEQKKKYEKSNQYNKEQGVFENRRPELIREVKKRTMNLKMIMKWLSEEEDQIPSQNMPTVKPNMKDFTKVSNKTLKVIWLGHSSLLLNMDGKFILLDPVFGETAAPVNFMVKRFQEPVLKLDELPEIDYIVISHDHYDHLDMKTIKHFRNRSTTFITPLGVGLHLKKWGINSNKIVEKDWWESVTYDGIEFISTPAQHFSGRNGIKDNETLWSSWVLKSQNHNIYFSGDSGYDTHFKEIGNKYGPFDIAFIECGQYNENWSEVHMLPKESILAFKDLKAKKYFPIHWGMFKLSYHRWYEPAEKLKKLAKDNNILLTIPKIGQILNNDQSQIFVEWWKSEPNGEKQEISKNISLNNS